METTADTSLTRHLEKSAIAAGLRALLSEAILKGCKGSSLQAILEAIVQVEAEIQQDIDEANRFESVPTSKSDRLQHFYRLST